MEVKWIKGDLNPADAMTKSNFINAFKWLIDMNILQLEVEEWVESD